MLALALLACAPEAGKPKGPPTGPFAVSEYFVPSGAMGDGATPGNLTIGEAPCKERPDGARGACYSFEYLASEPYETPSGNSGVCNWAGVFFQYPENNWGGEPGLAIPGGMLATVSFVAAVGEGSASVTFQIGGLGTPPGEPPPTDACPPSEEPPGDYYDQLSATETVMLDTEWQRFELPISARIEGTPIESLIGAFAWSVSATETPLPKTIYIDDLVYE